MRILITTELNLKNILLNPEDNIWYDIVKNLEKCYVSHDESSNYRWNTDKMMLDFHKAQVKIENCSPIIDGEKVPNILKKVGAPILLLDVDEDKAEKISMDYGVLCNSIKYKGKPVIAKLGWDIETTDKSKPQSWNYMLDDANKNFTSLVIIDRYLYASQYDQKNGDPDNDLDDTDYNLSEILENLLPSYERKTSIIVTFIFSASCSKGGKGDMHNYSFKELVLKIENVMSTISRQYEVHYEVISIDKECAYYNDTHDRFIFSNYFIVEASKMLKAYRAKGEILAKQKLSFDYLYSKGIGEDTKSSIPITTQERMLSALNNYLNSEENKEKICYAYNGEVVRDFKQCASKNPLLTNYRKKNISL